MYRCMEELREKEEIIDLDLAQAEPTFRFSDEHEEEVEEGELIPVANFLYENIFLKKIGKQGLKLLITRSLFEEEVQHWTGFVQLVSDMNEVSLDEVSMISRGNRDLAVWPCEGGYFLVGYEDEWEWEETIEEESD